MDGAVEEGGEGVESKEVKEGNYTVPCCRTMKHKFIGGFFVVCFTCAFTVCSSKTSKEKENNFASKTLIHTVTMEL